jgi:hypothetical protein
MEERGEIGGEKEEKASDVEDVMTWHSSDRHRAKRSTYRCIAVGR